MRHKRVHKSSSNGVYQQRPQTLYTSATTPYSNHPGVYSELAPAEKKEEENKPIRVFDFNGMHFEIFVKPEGTLDLQHIKVIIPDQPSRNVEIIHQFNVLNKLRRRKLSSSDFPAAYEREVANRYMDLQPDEREIVFNLLQAEFNAL